MALVVLGIVEQRLQAVLEVLNQGRTVTEVAARYGVARQTLHRWLGRYQTDGIDGLEDRSHRQGPLLASKVRESAHLHLCTTGTCVRSYPSGNPLTALLETVKALRLHRAEGLPPGQVALGD